MPNILTEVGIYLYNILKINTKGKSKIYIKYQKIKANLFSPLNIIADSMIIEI